MMSPAAGGHRHQARQLHQAAAGRRAGHCRRPAQAGRRRTRAACSCIAQPWPGMLRGIWGDDERYVQQYWTKVPHHYLTGDNARRDDDGYYWIMGRIDDVINVAGHRLSTIEVESALVSHPARRRSRRRRPPARNQGRGDLLSSSRSKRATPDDALKAGAQGARPQGNRRPGRRPTTSASPPPCPRPAAARSCAACSATSPPAKNDRRHEHAGRLQRAGEAAG